MKKKKIYGSIIGIFAFVVLILGVTYAYFYWSNEAGKNTNVNLTVPKDVAKKIIYNQGTSILETDGQVLSSSESYNGGISATIEFWKKPEVYRTIYGKVKLKILDMLSAANTEDANIAKTDTLKWTITSYSCENDYYYDEEFSSYFCNNDPSIYEETVINEGTFNGREIDDIFAIAQDFELNNYPTYYKIYLWVDENEFVLSLPITGELISVEISAEARDELD